MDIFSIPASHLILTTPEIQPHHDTTTQTSQPTFRPSPQPTPGAIAALVTKTRKQDLPPNEP
jgi:hypothetical protein